MSNNVANPNNGRPEVGNNASLKTPAIQSEQERLQKALARRMAEHSASGVTNRLAGRTLDSVRSNNAWFPSLTRGGSVVGGYVILPMSLAEKADLAKMPRWRVELHGLNGSAQPIGFDLIGDVVLGRGKDGPAVPDVDLDQFGAQKLGVSRRHVILRPTEKHLYLIDLNSTNGTMQNGLPVGPGVARSMQHNDVIMLGDFTFTLKIVARPGVPNMPTTSDRASYTQIIQQEAARRELARNAAPENMTTQMPLPPARKVPSETNSTPSPDPVVSQAAAIAAEPPTPIPVSATEIASEMKSASAKTPAKPARIMGLRNRLMGR